ncbi:hypothetical protein DSM107010_10150 [Chroococcidiopsis cubana SAG 39.79]|uniref:Uncharacterized protein n=1 Tax=Chroococcidiopsis cubana SAG 39.79 TaxID=388085 RepID=A0AB37UQV6_9CYAN|nr:hypothetical protein DSM107010_10150 [Chroococcidiopsis cubana SAG 39.79]
MAQLMFGAYRSSSRSPNPLKKGAFIPPSKGGLGGIEISIFKRVTPKLEIRLVSGAKHEKVSVKKLV